MLAAQHRIHQLRIRQFLNYAKPMEALDGLHGCRPEHDGVPGCTGCIVKKIVVELQDTPWHRCKAIMRADNSRSIARANLRNRAWTKAKLDITQILSGQAQKDLRDKWGQGNDSSIDAFSNPECRRILVLFGVPDPIAKRQTLAKRHETLRHFKNQSDSTDPARGGDTPRYTRKKINAPIKKKEELQVRHRGTAFRRPSTAFR